jgi:hypothetical protein
MDFGGFSLIWGRSWKPHDFPRVGDTRQKRLSARPNNHLRLRNELPWGGYTRVFFGGARIERSHDLFTLKNGVFHFKMHFFTQNALLSAMARMRACKKMVCKLSCKKSAVFRPRETAVSTQIPHGMRSRMGVDALPFPC